MFLPVLFKISIWPGTLLGSFFRYTNSGVTLIGGWGSSDLRLKPDRVTVKPRRLSTVGIENRCLLKGTLTDFGGFEQNFDLKGFAGRKLLFLKGYLRATTSGNDAGDGDNCVALIDKSRPVFDCRAEGDIPEVESAANQLYVFFGRCGGKGQQSEHHRKGKIPESIHYVC